MFDDKQIRLLIVKGRKNHVKTLKVIRDSDLVEDTKRSCNDVILDVDEDRAFSTFRGMGNFERLEFSILLDELYGE